MYKPLVADLRQTLEATLERVDSFWTDLTDQPTQQFVLELQRSVVVQILETIPKSEELPDSFSAHPLPATHVPFLHLQTSVGSIGFSPSWTLGDGSGIGVGGLTIGQGSQPAWLLALPDGVRHVSFVTDRPWDEQAIVGPDLFEVDGRFLVFSQDPTTLLPVTVLPNGDQRLDLWLQGVEIDRNQVYRTLGNRLGMSGASSEAYARAARSVERFIREKRLNDVRDGIRHSTGLPLVVEGGEVVTDIQQQGQEWVVVTDSRVYRLPPPFSPSVSVGDTLEELQPLSDDLYLRSHAEEHLFSSVPALAFSAAVGGKKRELVVPNIDTIWSVTAGTPLRVEFPLGGGKDFWDEVYARSSDAPAGQDLASLLGINSVADVVAVNPLSFVLHHFYSGTPFVASNNGLPIRPITPFVDRLRAYLGPETRLIMLTVVPQQSLSTSLAASETGAAFYFGQAGDTLSLPSSGPNPVVSVA